MGYTTDFTGELKLSRPLSEAEAAYLEAFRTTRRMARDSKIAETFDDPLRLAVGLPIGIEGGFYVGNQANFGQGRDESIIDYNRPPSGQPGLWTQWQCAGDTLKWDGGEKFYNYVGWLEYIIDNFLAPWGIEVSGVIRWVGEDSFDDRGSIEVVESEVFTHNGHDLLHITETGAEVSEYIEKADKTRGKKAYEAMAEYDEGGDSETDVTDLLAGLMHFCGCRGIDFDNQLRVARNHFEEELREAKS